MKRQLIIAFIGVFIVVKSLGSSSEPIFYEKNYIAVTPWVWPSTCTGIALYPKKGLSEKIRLVAQCTNLVTGQSTLRGTVLLADFPKGGVKIGAVPVGYQYRLYAYLTDEKKGNPARRVSVRDYLNFEIIDMAECAELDYAPLMLKYRLSSFDKVIISLAFLAVVGLGARTVHRWYSGRSYGKNLHKKEDDAGVFKDLGTVGENGQIQYDKKTGLPEKRSATMEGNFADLESDFETIMEKRQRDLGNLKDQLSDPAIQNIDQKKNELEQKINIFWANQIPPPTAEKIRKKENFDDYESYLVRALNYQRERDIEEVESAGRKK